MSHSLVRYDGVSLVDKRLLLMVLNGVMWLRGMSVYGEYGQECCASRLTIWLILVSKMGDDVSMI